MQTLDQLFATPGFKSRLARDLGIRVQAISQWPKGKVPAGRVLAVERLTGIHRHFLNPEIYPDPPSGQRGRAA